MVLGSSVQKNSSKKSSIVEYVSITILIIVIAYFIYNEVLFVEAITNDVLGKGDEGYVSDEIWYVNAARNILHKIFRIDPRTPCGECYTVFFYENATAMPPVVFNTTAKKTGVEILDKYVKTGDKPYFFMYVKAGSKDRLEAFIKELGKKGVKVRDYVRGWIYGKAENIDKYLNTEHPPLAKYFIALSMVALGDKPFSWRIPSIISGALILVFAYIVTRRILIEKYDRRVSSITALAPPILLALDPVHKYLSSLALLDIHVGLLTLITFYIMVETASDIKKMLSVVVASTAKFSGLFIGLMHLVEKFLEPGVKEFTDRLDNMLYLLVKYFIVFLIVQAVVSIPLIQYLGFLEWFNQAIPGAFRWHTSIKHPIGQGPVVSTPLDWVLGRNSFVLYFWSSGEPLFARGNWFFYLASFLLALILIPLAVADKTYRKAWLGLMSVYGGYIILWLLGGRTQYSYYLAQIAPFFYINLVVAILCIIPQDFNAKYKTGLRRIREILWIERYSRVVETEKLIGLTLILVSIGLSTILHAPWSQPRIYSDIDSMYWSVYGSSKLTYGIPYIDYRFPYLPGPAWVFMITTMTRFFLGYDKYLGIDKGFYAYYILNAILSFIAAYIILEDLLFLGKRTSRANKLPLYFYAVLPSMIIYGVYSWDIIVLMFILRSFRMFIEGRYRYAGVFTAAASLFNPLYSLILVLYVYELGRRAKDVVGYFLVTILVGLALPLLHPKALMDIVAGFFGHYIEGSWLFLVAPSPSDTTIISVAWCISFIAGVLVAIMPTRYTSVESVYGKLVVLVSLSMLLSPLYKPQYNLVIATLWLPLLDLVYTPILVVQDFAATTVILTWFTGNPLVKTSAPQVANYIKCFLLLVIIMYNIGKYVDVDAVKKAVVRFRESLTFLRRELMRET